jgi:acyl-CoA synthetase (AMP-forming)/AMP-acid ligase II
MSENLSSLFERFSNFADLLKWRATVQPNEKAYVFLDDGEIEGAVLTYQELDSGAKSVAAQLQRYTEFGERALLLYPPGLDFLTAFFGCLYAGVVAVPVDMPRRNQRTQRLQKIVDDARTNLILTVQEVLPLLEKDFPGKNIQFIETDCLAADRSASLQPPEISRDALALLQYTSGSTGNPKGVMVSHGNLLHNEEMLRLSFRHPENTALVTWLPLFHDMGLIGNMLHSMYLGVPNYVMSPVAFLQKPLRWLKAIEKYRATSSGGPNFAYDLCVSQITPEQRQDLDLSSWSSAFNGAEPIRAQTLQQFAQTFGECGFNPAAFYPCYGMAEATVFVTGGDRSAAPVIQEIANAALLENKIVTPHDSSSGADRPTFTPMVGCGKVWLGTEVAIVDPESLTRCAPDRVGEI